MIFGSVCSGIEAATVAWHPLGWSPAFFADVDPFASAVLAHHYGANLPGERRPGNAPPNLGDMTRFREWPDAALDVLVGGTPCQAFSVAGLRKGLDDPRGNLTLVFLGLVERYRPRWVVWENVPGVLLIDGGRAFGAFLGGLGQLGYGFAYRVLDAQYIRVDGYPRAVPQRRRRVFVVGHLGDWRRAAAVLLEPEGLRGDPAPRREAGQGAARPIAAGVRGSGGYRSDADTADNLIAASVAATLPAGGNATGGTRRPGESAEPASTMLVARALTAHHGRIDAESDTLVAHTLRARHNIAQRADIDTLVAHALRAEGFDASEDGTGRGTPLVPIAFDCKAGGDTSFSIGPVPGALRGEGHGGGHAAVAFTVSQNANGFAWEGEVNPALLASPPNAGANTFSGVREDYAVRRLTPRECERLQGFPDGYTHVLYRGKPAADGPRYRSLGNSMPVNVMRWIGARIALCEEVAA